MNALAARDAPESSPRARQALVAVAVAVLLGVVCQPVYGQSLPEGVGVDQHLGRMLPLDGTFQTAAGGDVRLGDLFGSRPVVLLPVYYRCPMLCGLELNALVRCLRAMPMTPGQEFDVVVYSIDPRETPELAVEKKAHYLNAYGRPEAAAGWHFLTGDAPNVEELSEAIGFRTRFNADTGEYSHAACTVICTPEGRISRYFLDVEFPPRDLRLALVEASQNTIGTVADQVLLFCFMYDPTTGKYGLAILRLIRVAGILTVIAIVSAVSWMLYRERRRDGQASGPPERSPAHDNAQPITQ